MKTFDFFLNFKFHKEAMETWLSKKGLKSSVYEINYFVYG